MTTSFLILFNSSFIAHPNIPRHVVNIMTVAELPSDNSFLEELIAIFPFITYSVFVTTRTSYKTRHSTVYLLGNTARRCHNPTCNLKELLTYLLTCLLMALDPS
jgi:hypothetical protein